MSYKKPVFRIVKPRSIIFPKGDTRPSRAYDREFGSHNGVDYVVEGCVREEESSLPWDRVNSLEGLMKFCELPEEAEKLRRIREKHPEWKVIQDCKPLIALLEYFSTRPSYSIPPVFYLLLLGIKLPGLLEEEIKVMRKGSLERISRLPRENERVHDSDFYEDSKYRQLLDALSTEKFRSKAREDAEKNRSNPETGKPGHEWRRDPEMLMKTLGRQANFYDSFYIINGAGVPLLRVEDSEEGHLSARDCIDFYKNQKIV